MLPGPWGSLAVRMSRGRGGRSLSSLGWEGACMYYAYSRIGQTVGRQRPNSSPTSSARTALSEGSDSQSVVVLGPLGSWTLFRSLQGHNYFYEKRVLYAFSLSSSHMWTCGDSITSGSGGTPHCVSTCFNSFFFSLRRHLFERERERERRLPVERGARRGARSQAPGIMG